MPNGKPGDHPITDILVHKLPVFTPRIDNMLRQIVALGGREELEASFDLFTPPPYDELDRRLADMLARFLK